MSSEKPRSPVAYNNLTRGQRMYATGDLGFSDDIGQVYFKGRKDNQVKINGFRIELQEIEAQICKVENVMKAVVTFKKGDDGSAILIGYFTGDANTAMVLRS